MSSPKPELGSLIKQKKFDSKLNYDLAFDRNLYYRSGNHSFPKCGSFNYNSSLLFFLAKSLELNPCVSRFYIRKFNFRYFHVIKNIFVQDCYDASTEDTHYYVSSEHFMHTPLENARIYAAKIQANEENRNFVVITEPDLFGDNPQYMRSLIRFILG